MIFIRGTPPCFWKGQMLCVVVLNSRLVCEIKHDSCNTLKPWHVWQNVIYQCFSKLILKRTAIKKQPSKLWSLLCLTFTDQFPNIYSYNQNTRLKTASAPDEIFRLQIQVRLNVLFTSGYRFCLTARFVFQVGEVDAHPDPSAGNPSDVLYFCHRRDHVQHHQLASHQALRRLVFLLFSGEDTAKCVCLSHSSHKLTFCPVPCKTHHLPEWKRACSAFDFLLLPIKRCCIYFGGVRVHNIT